MNRTFKIGGELEVERLGFGAMRITGPGIWGWPDDRTAAKQLLARVAELGIQLIDTADSYGPETSEYLIAEALHPYTGLVVATKGGLVRDGPGNWRRIGRPDHLKLACNNSLRRLKADTIDLYQLHAVDDDVPLEDSVGALTQLQQEGKIRHIGVSNFSVPELERARDIATLVSVQNRYSLTDRGHEPVLEYCDEHGIGFIPWFPLATGELSNHPEVKAVAQRYDGTASQLALAWLLQRSPVMLPIPGTSSAAHLEENTLSREIELSEEDFTTLSRLAATAS